MTNTNSVQNVINEVLATRGATVSVFGHPQEMPATVAPGYVDIIEILEGFKGYEAETTIPARYDIEHDEETDTYSIVDSEGTVIEDGFHAYSMAEATQLELENENQEPASVDEFIEYMDELGWIEEKSADNSYNWAGKVSNHFDFRTYYKADTDQYLVELKVHLYGDVRANYTDSVLLVFPNDYFFYEGIAEVSGYEEYKGYGIRFSATYEGYEIFHLESDEDMEEKYAWEDVIEYINGLVEEEISEEV
jgi:hypothetical protein